MNKIGILVGGGPAPGINSVIEAAQFINLYQEGDSDPKKETNRRTLNRTVNGGKSVHPIISKYTWSLVEECGIFVE